MNKPRKTDDSEFRNSVAGQKLMALIQDPKAGPAIGQALAELAIELADAIQEKNHWRASFETVKNDRHSGVPLIHKVATLQLPMRLVTEAEERLRQRARHVCQAARLGKRHSLRSHDRNLHACRF